MFYRKRCDSDSCLASANISKDSLQTCLTSTDQEYKINENFQNKTGEWKGQFPPFSSIPSR